MNNSNSFMVEESLSSRVVSTPERQLYAAIILQAIQDLTYLPKTRKTRMSADRLHEIQRVRDDARRFLFSRHPHFTKLRKLWFLSAGLNIDIGPRSLLEMSNRFEEEHRNGWARRWGDEWEVIFVY